MQKEVAETKEYLQSMIEERDVTNEELRASNEELQSSTEELQSINEELETAKEELQSSNEELTTVNEELQNRNQELVQTNNDLINLINSVNLPIVMLDNDLRVRRTTPLAEKVLNIRPSDVGRSITDVKLGVDIPGLETMITECIETVGLCRTEIEDRDGRRYFVQLRPYMTADRKIEGALLTLMDIEEASRDRDMASYLADIIDSLRVPFIVLDSELKVISANRAFYRVFQITPEETECSLIYQLGNHQWDIPELRELLENIIPAKNEFDGFRVEQTFPAGGRRVMLLNARRLVEKAKGRELILLGIEDITNSS